MNVWSENNELLRTDYQKSNIKIIDCNKQSNVVLLFCSGNGLYYPNTEEEYCKKIRKQDRYEWENIANNDKLKKSVSRMIFIRDIYKQWYVTGINAKYNTIDKVVECLKQQTVDSRRLIVVGNSAGGYAAVVLGILLKASRIITVSGQFRIDTNSGDIPFLKKYANDADRNKYYDLRPLLAKNKVPIFYFFPNRCNFDVEQYNLVKNFTHIYFFKLNSDLHGAGINSRYYADLFICNQLVIRWIYYLYYRNRLVNSNVFMFNVKTAISIIRNKVKRCLHR